MDPDREECLYNTFDLEILENIITRQRRALKQAKLQRLEELPQVLIVVDDFADDTKVTRGNMRKNLFVRGILFENNFGVDNFFVCKHLGEVWKHNM